MSIRTITRVIPKQVGASTFEVPREIWDPIMDRVAEHENAQLRVHDHRAPGEYHGRAFVDVAHYLLELVAPEDDISGIIEEIDPDVNQLIADNVKAGVALREGA